METITGLEIKFTVHLKTNKRKFYKRKLRESFIMLSKWWLIVWVIVTKAGKEVSCSDLHL